ncbi:MAG: hypothetical protein KBS69_06755, partial [Bacteroidales bacterium]|nr:hypothetical protein [Candidatus Colicola caccequi]
MQEKLVFICYFNQNSTGIYEGNYKEFLGFAMKFGCLRQLEHKKNTLPSLTTKQRLTLMIICVLYDAFGIRLL